jgi:ribosomal protein S18 acetylase RimI-like enzyme
MAQQSAQSLEEPDMRSRKATQADVPAMVELQRIAFLEALVPLLPETFQPTVLDAWRHPLSQALATDGVRAFVTEGGGGLAGLVVYGLNRDAEPPAGAGEIRALFVHPSRWRSGLGRDLVERACADLGEMGYSAATLWSLRDNERANGFYERLGFKRDGATQTREHLGGPEVRYAKSLL